MKRCGCYVIRNRINGKRYIGSSNDIARRWSEHRSALNQNKHRNRHLQAAWRKHGPESFSFRVLRTCTAADLQRIEQSFLSHLNPPEYNIARDAHAPMRGRKLSEETKAKLRGRKRSAETLRRMRLAAKNRDSATPATRKRMSIAAKLRKREPHSPQTRERMSIARRNRPAMSEKTKRKIAATLRGRRASTETRQKLAVARQVLCKTVLCTDLITGVTLLFDSITHAARTTGTRTSSIRYALRAEDRTSAGCVWQLETASYGS